jgi:hypothetical protein
MADNQIDYIALRLRDGTIGAVITRTALELHLLAAAVARSDGRRMVISDAFLSTLAGVDTTTYALELETAGMWQRTDDGGYRFSAPWLNRTADTDEDTDDFGANDFGADEFDSGEFGE